MKKLFKTSVLNRVGRNTAVFLKAANGTNFVVPYGMDLPKRTCKKYGVLLKSEPIKSLGIRVVTVFKIKLS
jgi:hypothetical protein